jgi:hypothetical protein
MICWLSRSTRRWLPAILRRPASRDASSDGLAIATNRRFKFHERGQLFIRTHNETLSIIAMRVFNPDRSPA